MEMKENNEAQQFDKMLVSMPSLRQSKQKAEELLNGKKTDELERFLESLEKKLKEVPKIGDTLSRIPLFASMVKSYVQHEYTEVPFGTVLAVLTALIYFVSPIDAIPDSIPGIGLLDDAAVVYIVATLIDTDLTAYQEWRDAKKA